MKQIDFTPVGDRIIVIPEESSSEVKLSGGVILTVQPNTTDKELPQRGLVVALGTGGTFPECPDPTKVFSIGDTVYFNKYAGEEFEIEDEQEVTEPKETHRWEKDDDGTERHVLIPKDQQVMHTVTKRVKQKLLVLRLDAVFGKINVK
jgi:chaperonin GroES